MKALYPAKMAKDSAPPFLSNDPSNRESALYSPAFLAMALANLFTVSSFGSFFLLPLFITHRGGSESDIGVVMGAMAMAAVICRPWIAEMVDRIGRKRSYTIGTIIMSVVPLTYLSFRGDLSDFYFPLLLVRVVQGVGLALCFTAAFTYITDIVPEGRLNEGLSMFGVTGLTGLAVGPVIAEAIILRFGFSIFFVAISGLAFLGLLLHIPLSESYHPASKKGSTKSFFAVMRGGKASTVTVLALLFGFGLAASGSFVAPFAKEQHLALISLYYIAYSSAAILTRLFGGKLGDRIGEDKIIPYALTLTGVGLLTMIFLGGSGILVLSGLMTGSGHGFLFPSLNALAVRQASIEIRGKVNGVFTGGIDAGAFLGSLLLGYIGEWAGYRTLFLAAGLALLVGLVVFNLRRNVIAQGVPG